MKNGIGKAHSMHKRKKNPYKILVKKSQEKRLPTRVKVSLSQANRHRRGMDQ
jgi:hypothetical protein